MRAAPIPARVAKLLPLLGSDKAGEVVATAAAIGRTLTLAGLDWHALAALVERHASPTARSASSDPGALFSFGTITPAQRARRWRCWPRALASRSNRWRPLKASRPGCWARWSVFASTTPTPRGWTPCGSVALATPPHERSQ